MSSVKTVRHQINATREDFNYLTQKTDVQVSYKAEILVEQLKIAARYNRHGFRYNYAQK